MQKHERVNHYMAPSSPNPFLEFKEGHIFYYIKIVPVPVLCAFILIIRINVEACRVYA